jgi:uncharacterized protein
MHNDDAPALEQLTRYESLRFLATVPIGRIIFTRRALPAVELVHFALDHGDIVIGANPDDTLAADIRDAVVAFEADSLDVTHRAGWSVAIIGRSRVVTDPGEIDRLQKIGLRSWGPGKAAHFIRISPELLTGRRLRTDGEGNDREDVAVRLVSA